MAKYYNKRFKWNSQIPDTELASKKRWEPWCIQSWPEGRWALGTNTSILATPLCQYSPMLSSHTPSCVHFLWTEGFCIHDCSVAQLQQENGELVLSSQPHEVWWLCWISMWHESCELESV